MFSLEIVLRADISLWEEEEKWFDEAGTSVFAEMIAKL